MLYIVTRPRIRSSVIHPFLFVAGLLIARRKKTFNVVGETGDVLESFGLKLWVLFFSKFPLIYIFKNICFPYFSWRNL